MNYFVNLNIFGKYIKWNKIVKDIYFIILFITCFQYFYLITSYMNHKKITVKNHIICN